MRMITTVKQMARQLKDAIVYHLNKDIAKRADRAQKEVREFTRIFLKGTETYKSLTKGGGLQGDFGFPAGEENKFADWFIDTIADNINVKSDIMRVRSNDYFGSVYVTLPYEAYDKLMNGIYAHVPIKGGSIPWTEWLLKRGDEIIIHDYHLVFEEREGRTGYAIMGKGGSWKMPAKYSGTENDNFITRTIYDSDQYLKALLKILARNLL